MLKGVGAVLGALSVVWMVFLGEVAWGSVMAGVVLGGALFVVLCPTGETKVEVPDVSGQIAAMEKKAEEVVGGMKGEVQRLEQKAVRAEERCFSYQNLVDVHQGEIEKLKQENKLLAEEHAQQERKLTALHFARQEPDLFD